MTIFAKRALVVHTGGIGDLILTFPALTRLAAEFRVEVAGNRERVALTTFLGCVEKIHDLDAVEFHTVFTEPSPKLRSFLRAFDRAIVWLKDDGAVTSALRQCGVADVLAFPGIPPTDWRSHASDYFMSCLGFEEPASWAVLNTLPSGSLDVVIHPGSGGSAKNWPLANFESVAKALTERGRSITWIRGPAEERLPYPKIGAVLRSMRLTELAECLADAKLYIGNDSGITHLAAAVGCPTIAIFGSTDPAVWAPLGSHARVITGSPWPTVDEVLNRTT